MQRKEIHESESMSSRLTCSIPIFVLCFKVRIAVARVLQYNLPCDKKLLGSKTDVVGDDMLMGGGDKFKRGKRDRDKGSDNFSLVQGSCLTI